MNTTRSGEMASVQIGKMGIIDTTSDFSLSDGQRFNVKNDGEERITLEVQLAQMDDFISTSFDVGWNPEIVLAVKQTSQPCDLKWGY